MEICITGNEEHWKFLFPFVKHYTAEIDTMKRHKFDIEEERSRKVFEEQEKAERHREFIATEGAKLVMKNDAIKERISQEWHV